MSIDWITVLAQLANFLLLVWLLRRFLYRPILDGIDAREAEIARRLAAAEAAREDARAAEQRYQQQHERTLAERDTMLAQALRATEARREQLLSEARAQRDDEHREWQRQLEAEREDFAQRLQRAGALTLLQLLRKVMHDLADAPLEAAIARRIGRQLEPMAAELSAAAGTHTEAIVTTHEALDDDAQAQMREEFAALLPGVRLRFAVDREQAPGIVMQLGAARVAWTIDSYLDDFESAMLEDQVTCLPVRRLGGVPSPAERLR
ncbi:MAG: hypothetical protein LC125_13830 [Burkholderiales bacterium]|nr:hypothetical protein [Burkholderiales bacterium]